MEDPTAPNTATWDNTVYGPPGRGTSRRKPPPAHGNGDPPPRKKAKAPKPTTPVDEAEPAEPAESLAPKTATNSPAATEVLEKTLLEDLDEVMAESPSRGEDAESPTPANATPAETAVAPADTASIFERTSLWARLVSDPGSTPEHLTAEAVRILGPNAEAWAARTRERYPQARPDALARLATEEHIRTARTQAMANTTAVGSWTEVGLLARTQASLVLTIAAVYGIDPTAEERSRDLLELLPVPQLTQPSLEAASIVGRIVGAVAVRRLAARLVPFGAAVAAVIHSGRTTQDVGMRSIDRFRPSSSLHG